MNLEQVMKELESMGSEQTKKIMIKHGTKEPFFGVKIADSKKLSKKIKNNTELAKQLYNTGNYDAMYLGAMIVNPKEIDEKTIEDWSTKSNCYMLAEYALPSVVAHTKYAKHFALKWMDSDDELVQSSGWSLYTNILAITKDEELDIQQISEMLDYIKTNIHTQTDRVKYTMNGFIISVGAYVIPLMDKSIEVAKEVGDVYVDMGDTSCKVPNASDYIDKMIKSNKCGKKRKSVKC